MFDAAVASVPNKNALSPTELKNAINKNIRRIIKEAPNGPGKTVRDVLLASGFEYVDGVGFAMVKQP